MQVTIVATVTLAQSASVPNESAEKPTESNVETFDSYSVKNLPEQLPLTIQLPREELGAPFYPAQPVPYLKAPQFIPNTQSDNFYEVPVPSEYLTAPTEGAWYPYKDPTLYYELPASITKENVPTNDYPKKYNKDIHAKSKPLSTLPKQELELEPINEAQYVLRQKELYKTIQKLNKKENQKNLEQEIKVPIRHHSNSLRPNDRQTKSTSPRPVKITPADAVSSATTFGQNTDNDHQDANNKFTRGLSPEITNSLGITSNHGGGQDGRVLFHMAGHDGPMSYKWGYDTGKG